MVVRRLDFSSQLLLLLSSFNLHPETPYGEQASDGLSVGRVPSIWQQVVIKKTG